MSKWTEKNIPDQSGKVVIVTGSNSGLGFETARALVEHGAKVVIAVRSLDKGQTAAQKIGSELAEVMHLDLASLASVKAFADGFMQKYDQLDILMNNAGAISAERHTTPDGHESQFGINHLGHFALTAHLYPLLKATTGSRVINISSKAADGGKMNWGDLMCEQAYAPFTAYAQSKLANLLFTNGLQKRFSKAGVDVIAVAAHPGGSSTSFTDNSGFGGVVKLVVAPIMNALMQSAAQGALPQLFAATDPSVKGGDYFGPNGFQELRGYPKLTKMASLAHNAADIDKLWDVSEELAGVEFMIE